MSIVTEVTDDQNRPFLEARKRFVGLTPSGHTLVLRVRSLPDGRVEASYEIQEPGGG